VSNNDDKSVSGLSRKFAMLKALKEHHERILKVINTDMMAVGKELYESFADEEVTQLRVPGKFFTDQQERIVKPDLKFKGTIVKEHQTEFFTYLRTQNFGALIKETIHHKTLETWIAKRKKANAPLPSEDLLKIFTIETANVKRAPKRAENGEEPTEIVGEEEPAEDEEEGEESNE
jgi:hypothetical protein